MCVVSTPKVQAPPKDKPLPVLRNPLLDGLLGNLAAMRNDRNGLRIDRINPLTIPPGGIGGGGANTIGGGGSTGGSISGGGGGITGGTSTLSGSGISSGGSVNTRSGDGRLAIR